MEFQDVDIVLIKHILFSCVPSKPWNQHDGLLQKTGLALSTIEHHLEQLEQMSWLDSSTLQIMNIDSLLIALTEQYQQHLRVHHCQWHNPFQPEHYQQCLYMAKKRVTPMSGRHALRYHIWDKVTWITPQQLSKEHSLELLCLAGWCDFDDHNTEGSVHDDIVSAPLILHVRSKTSNRKWPTLTAEKVVKELHLQPCALEQAHILLLEHPHWQNSIFDLVAHQGGAPSVDFLQSYIDAVAINAPLESFDLLESTRLLLGSLAELSCATL